MAVIVPAIAGKVIHIGRAGENLATTVQFDVADWIKPVSEGGFGTDGTFSLFVQQGGGQIYPQNLVEEQASELDSNIVEWNITDSNTATIGLGKCELVYSINTGETDEEDNPIFQKVKSVIYDIVVTNSLDIEAQGNVPSAIDSWLNEVSGMVDQINDAANQADKAERYAKGTSNGVVVASGTVGYNDNAKYYSDLAASNADKVGYMTATTTTSGAGTNASVEITTENNHYNLAFTIPRGNTGATGATGADGVDGVDGISPTLSSEKVGKTTTIKYTDKNHTSGNDVLATILDGQDGTGAGTVTSIGISNATNGGLTVSGSPISTTGTITVGHTNILTSAQTTQAVYPIKIDKNGHISAYGSAVSIPTATNTSPKMDGEATVGSETTWAKGDHIHPTDTTRQAKITASGILKGNGSGTISEASAGTDYIAPPSSPNNGNILTYNGTSWVASAPAFVPTSRTINSKALSSNITLNASDVGALSSSTLGAANGVAELDSHGKIKATQASARLVTLSQFTTLQDIHDGCILYNSSTSARSLTVKSLYEGFECEVMKYNTGNVTINADGDVYLNGVLGGSKQITEQYTSAVLKAIDATHWVIQGAIS